MHIIRKLKCFLTLHACQLVVGLQSLPTATEATRLVDNLGEILSSGGFEIRQWAFVIEHLPKEVKDHKCYSMFDLNSRPD